MQGDVKATGPLTPIQAISRFFETPGLYDTYKGRTNPDELRPKATELKNLSMGERQEIAQMCAKALGVELVSTPAK